ncbi:hypothetical protein JOD29_000947 [Lysinibacillus composti]|nr:hypothetical protein [Lysinibacillus composti]
MYMSLSFGSLPMWFFIIAFVFAIVFIIYAEWNSRS